MTVFHEAYLLGVSVCSKLPNEMFQLWVAVKMLQSH